MKNHKYNFKLKIKKTKEQQKVDTHTQRLRIKSTKKVQRKLLIFFSCSNALHIQIKQNNGNSCKKNSNNDKSPTPTRNGVADAYFVSHCILAPCVFLSADLLNVLILFGPFFFSFYFIFFVSIFVAVVVVVNLRVPFMIMRMRLVIARIAQNRINSNAKCERQWVERERNDIPNLDMWTNCGMKGKNNFVKIIRESMARDVKCTHWSIRNIWFAWQKHWTNMRNSLQWIDIIMIKRETDFGFPYSTCHICHTKNYRFG